MVIEYTTALGIIAIVLFCAGVVAYIDTKEDEEYTE